MPPFWPHFQTSFLYSLCVSHNGLLVLPRIHARPSHIRSCAVTVPTGRCPSPEFTCFTPSLHPVSVLFHCHHLRVACSVYPCLNGYHFPWPSLFFTLILTTYLPVYVYNVVLLSGNINSMKARDQGLSLLLTLVTSASAISYRMWLVEICWVKKVNRMTFVKHLYYSLFSSSWNTCHHHPQPLASSTPGSPGSVSNTQGLASIGPLCYCRLMYSSHVKLVTSLWALSVHGFASHLPEQPSLRFLPGNLSHQCPRSLFHVPASGGFSPYCLLPRGCPLPSGSWWIVSAWICIMLYFKDTFSTCVSF